MNKKYFLFLAMILVFSFAACSNKVHEVDEKNEGIPTAEVHEPEKKQFVIAGMMTNTEANQFKEEYQDLVDVEIVVEICENGYQGEYEKYVQQLSASLMAGTAPDVFYLPSELFFDYGISAYTYDINQFLENDPTVNRSDYYENILDAFEIDGKLPVWPNDVSHIAFTGLHRNLVNDINPSYFEKDTITYREMLKYYYEMEEGKTGQYSLFENHNVFTTLLIGEGYDLKNQQVYFNNEEYSGLLELAKGAEDPTYRNKLGYLYYGIYANRGDRYNYVFNTPILSQKEMFLPSKDDYWYEFDNGVNPPFLYGPSGLFTDPKPLVSEKGELFLFYGGYYAVNANSENLDLAWEFLKYSATDKVVPWIVKTHNIMLNKELNERYMYSDLEYYIKTAFIGTALPPQAELDKIVLTQEHQEDIRQTAEKLLSYCEMPMILTTGDIPETIEILESYNHDLISAPQAAQQLQNKVSLKFME